MEPLKPTLGEPFCEHLIFRHSGVNYDYETPTHTHTAWLGVLDCTANVLPCTTFCDPKPPCKRKPHGHLHRQHHPVHPVGSAPNSPAQTVAANKQIDVTVLWGIRARDARETCVASRDGPRGQMDGKPGNGPLTGPWKLAS